MYKGEPIIPKPMGRNNIVRPPSGKPKGLGRLKPHSSEFTRNGKTSSNGAAIASGLNKIHIFFTGKPMNKPVKPRNFLNSITNPFKSMINTLLKGTK